MVGENVTWKSTGASGPEEAGSLGRHVRDDRGNQIEFVNLVIDEFSANGVIEPRRSYKSSFTDVSPRGLTIAVDGRLSIWPSTRLPLSTG